jgi:hypothetical protein
MDFSNFYTLVLTIAIIVLLLLLGYMGWLMSKQKSTDEFPKLRTSCPDFWKVEPGDNGKVFCIRPVKDPNGPDALNDGNKDGAKTNDVLFANAKGVKSDKTGFDTTDAGWASAGNAVCGKQKWANANGITWDTVTNANFC